MLYTINSINLYTYVTYVYLNNMLQVIQVVSYSLSVYLQVLVVNMALNQTWIALLIFVLSGFPGIAFRLSPVISSVAGFTSGFFIPRESMPPWLVFVCLYVCYIAIVVCVFPCLVFVLCVFICMCVYLYVCLYVHIHLANVNN